MLARAEARTGQPIVVLSDEPYKSYVFDGKHQPEVASSIANTAICNSWSKSMGLAGERIGYLALSPRLPDLPALRGACAFVNRTLGYINAPAIWQWVIRETADKTIDIAPYEHKRNVLCGALKAIGYDVTPPEGSFYVFLEDAHRGRRRLHAPFGKLRCSGGSRHGLRP